MMSWLTDAEIEKMGFASVGKNVCLSRHAAFYNTGNIHIGDHSRIDDFCFISAGIEGIQIGRNVHISAFSSVVGQALIEFQDFSGISNKVAIFSSSDDFINGMTNPTVPDMYRRVVNKPVILGRHAVVGANSVILPGAILSEGTSVGALSVIRKKLKPWAVYLGNPTKIIGQRSRTILKIEKQFLEDEQRYLSGD